MTTQHSDNEFSLSPANRPLTILMVDDDPAFTALLEKHLQRAGYHVITAAHTKAAWQILKQLPLPDLMVVDGLLPDANGIDFIRNVRGRQIQVPIIFLSAFWRDRTTFLHLTKDHGVEAVLHKPIVPETFVNRVRALLGSPVKIEALVAPEESAVLDLGVEDELERMRVEFGGKLGTKISLIAERLRVTRAEGSATGIHDVRALIHTLRGTAGTYGFSEISELLGQAEKWAVEVSENLASLARLAEPLDSILRKAIRLAGKPSGAESAGSRSTPQSRTAILVTGDQALADSVTHAGPVNDIEILCAPSLLDARLLMRGREPFCAVLAQIGSHEQDILGTYLTNLRALREKFFVPIGVLTPPVGLSPQEHAELIEAGVSFEFQEQSSVASIHKAVQLLAGLGGERKIRVMVVDDDLFFCRLMKGILQQAGMEVVACTEPLMVPGRLDQFSPDLVLLDENMPGLRGVALCKIIREDTRWNALPIFLLSADINVETKVDAFRVGVNDYLVKGIDRQELVARIKSRVLQDRRLLAESETDLLTGILNRRAFVQQASSVVQAARRKNTKLAVCMLDLDQFKSINDQFGHAAGDQVLSGFGQLLRSRFRVIDIRGRLGGEEFGVVFPGESKQSTLLAMRRLLAEFSATVFNADQTTGITASFSAGIAEFPGDGDSIESLLKAADQRLMRAKQAGRHRIEAHEGQAPLAHAELVIHGSHL